MNRRSLFGALALSPLMAVAAFAKEDISNDQPIPESTQITIMGSKKLKPVKSKYGLSFNNAETDPNKAVSMAVGEDGNLWLKNKNGNWKRIVTE